MDRAILHLDMDAFFAGVEILDNPELNGRPVVVGGTGRRGVVASCNYEARLFGIRSAMASANARKLCPDAVFIDGRYSRYQEVSAQLHEILLTVTPLVEPVGLDEAYMDVSGCRKLLGTPKEIANRLRERVLEETSMKCSIGVGRSKMIAKLASRAAKPHLTSTGIEVGHGVLEVPAASETEFLTPLPTSWLWGVGPVTKRRLNELGIKTIGELSAVPVAILVREFGNSHGTRLASLSKGVDESPVVGTRRAKSIGREVTFAEDSYAIDYLVDRLKVLSAGVSEQMREAGLTASRVSVKVRLGDLSYQTRSQTLRVNLDTGPSIAAVAEALLESVPVSRGVRLLGVSVSKFSQVERVEQLSLLSDPEIFGLGESDSVRSSSIDAQAAVLQTEWREILKAVDAIRDKYGHRAVGNSSTLTATGLPTSGRREAPWGPTSTEGSATNSDGQRSHQ